MEAGRNPAREMGQRNRAAGKVGRLEHGEITGLLLAAIEYAQQPAVALGRAVVSRHEDRLAEAVVLTGRPARALTGLEIVMDQPVGGRITGRRIGDILADNPAVPVVAHAAALVEARELAGAIVELLLAESVAMAVEVEGPAEQT